MTENVKINVLELITLNEIKKKHELMKLETSDQFISLMKTISTLNSDTSIEEIQQMQSQLRAMINHSQNDLKDIQDDKKFLDKIMKRSK